MRALGLFLLTTVSFWATLAVGAEADYFTGREGYLKREAGALLDERFQLMLDFAARSVPKDPSGDCSEREIIQSVLKVFGRTGSVQGISSVSDLVAPAVGEVKYFILGRLNQPPEDSVSTSIYRDLEMVDTSKALAVTYPERFGLNVFARSLHAIGQKGKVNEKTCCSPVISYKGHLVSFDKFEHFFQVGFDAYRLAENVDIPLSLSQKLLLGPTYAALSSKFAGQGEDAVLAFNQASEEGVFGLQATGVYSYSDAVANFEGYRFWKNLTRPLEGRAAYFACDRGVWRKNRTFTLAEYISDAWDESINCSVFRSEIKSTVESHIRELGLSCPVARSGCKQIVRRYSGARSSLISPLCRGALPPPPRKPRST